MFLKILKLIQFDKVKFQLDRNYYEKNLILIKIYKLYKKLNKIKK